VNDVTTFSFFWLLSQFALVTPVVEIMATVAETGDWKLAFECTIPKRKAYHHDGRAEYCTKSVDTHPRETDS